MTCYWDSVYSQLDLEDYRLIGVEKPNNITDLINLLKSKNKYINNVTWQNQQLSFNEKKEHYTAIDVYNIEGIRNGHLTSICDSFLLLICELFSISVEHLFLNAKINYEHIKSRKKLSFKSNNGHFQNHGFINKSQTRMERIKNKAIEESKQPRMGGIKSPFQTNQSVKQPVKQPIKQPIKQPSWRADPEGFNRWREANQSRMGGIKSPFQTKQPPTKKPSWRADPEGYNRWRESMRNMNR